MNKLNNQTSSCGNEYSESCIADDKWCRLSVYPSVLLTQRGQITNKCQSDLFIDTPSSIMIHDARGPVHFVTRCGHSKN